MKKLSLVGKLKGIRWKRGLCAFLSGALLMPTLIDVRHVLADTTQFTLGVEWTGVDEARKGNLPYLITNGKLNMELEPIVNSNTLNETTDSRGPNAPFFVGLQITVNPPTGVNANPEEIELHVPMYVFKGRDGTFNVTSSAANSVGTHAVTGSAHTSGLKVLREDPVKGEIVFTNWKTITGGDTIVLNMKYPFTPDKIANGFTNSNIIVTANYNPGKNIADPGAKALTSEPMTVKLDTHVAPPLRFTAAQYRPSDELTKYESWQANWGTKPANSVWGTLDVGTSLGFDAGGTEHFVTTEQVGKDKYFYLVWEVRYQYRPNRSTQPYWADMDFDLTPGSLGEIMGITGVNSLSSDYNWRQDFLTGTGNASFAANTGALANVAPSVDTLTIATDKKSATIHQLITPSNMDARSDYPFNMYRWVVVRYPRGYGADAGYEKDTNLNAGLKLYGIDEMNDPGEGRNATTSSVAKWQGTEVGKAGATPSGYPTYDTGAAAGGRGRFTGEPKYTHVIDPLRAPSYKYKPVEYSLGGLGYRSLLYDYNNYAQNNNMITLYSVLNRLSEGSATNPVSVPILRTSAEAYTFRQRAEADTYLLSRADAADIIPGIDTNDPRNYYAKAATTEVTDGLKYLNEHILTKDDYAVSKTYVTYTEYLDDINPNNGRLTATTSTNYNGANPARSYDKGYEPVEIWYKTLSSNNQWLLAGRVYRTGSAAGVIAAPDITNGMRGIYSFVTVDGTSLRDPASPMNEGNQLIMPRGTYEIKYVHTNTRFRVDITPYTTVELKSTERVRTLIDGGSLPSVVINGVTYPSATITRTDSVSFRSMFHMAVKDNTGAVRNFRDVGTAYTDSWPGASNNSNPTNVSPSYYQNTLNARSTELYPTTPSGKTVNSGYRYITLNRTNAATVMDKISTGKVKNGYVSVDSSPANINDDGDKGLKSVNQSVRMYERIVFNPSLVPGATIEEKLQDMADNKVYNLVTEGTFYDLLPPGTYIVGGVEAFTYYVDPGNSNGSAEGSRTNAAAANAANRRPAQLNYYTVDNWQGSGRTMLIASVKAPDNNGRKNYQLYSAPRDATYIGPDGTTHNSNDDGSKPAGRILLNDSGTYDIRSGFILNYLLETTYSNIFDRSDLNGDFKAYNVCAFRNTTKGTLGVGAASKLLAGGGTVPTSSNTPWVWRADGALAANGLDQQTGTSGANPRTPASRVYEFFMYLESQYPTRDDGKGDTVYTYNAPTFKIPDAYQFGPKKLVKSQSDPDFVAKAETVPGGRYQYQLYFLSGPVKLYGNIRMYDRLEAEASGGWRGKLINIDTTFAKAMGANPVMYYSTLPANTLAITEVTGPVGNTYLQLNGTDSDLANNAIWKPLPGTDAGIAAIADTITAIAVDMSKKADGTPFQLKKNESIYVVLNMQAPTDPLVYNPIISSGDKAVNGYIYSTTETDSKGTALSIARESNPHTEVTLRAYTLGLDKTSNPPSGTQTNPQAVDKDPASGANTIDYTISVINTDPLPAANVTVEDAMPAGVTFNKANIKYYFGADASKALPLPAAQVTQSGGKLTFVIPELYAKQTINLVIPTTVDPALAYGSKIENTSTITSINGADYNIGSPTTYHEVYPRVSIKGTKALTGRYARADEFVFVLYESNGTTEIARAKNDKTGSFAFPSLDFTTPGTYTYYVTEYPGGADYPTGSYAGTVPKNNLPMDNPGAFTYDSRTYKVEIEVADNGPSGWSTTITTTEGGSAAAGIAFENAYHPGPIYLPVELNKTLQGRNLNAGEFKFAVKDVDANAPADLYTTGKTPSPLTGDLTHNGKGEGEFALKFDAEGTYTYEITEIIPSAGSGLANVRYDDTVYTLTVVIGKAAINPNPATGNPPLSSEQRKDGQLSVLSQTIVRDVNGVPTAVNGIAFTNVFTPQPTTALISGVKVMEGGRSLVKGEFTFELYDVTDKSKPAVLVQGGVTNGTGGAVAFAPIDYTPADVDVIGKTFYYEVREVTPDPADKHITYSPAVPLRVEVSINRQLGQLASVVRDKNGVEIKNGAASFTVTNNYTADELTVPLDAVKTVIGNATDPLLTTAEFKFNLIDETSSIDTEHFYRQQNVPKTGGGTINFNPISFTSTTSVPFKMRVVELNTGNIRVDYDPAVFHFTIGVTQDPETGELTTTNPAKPIELIGADKIEFKNILRYYVTFDLNYNPPASAPREYAKKLTNYDTTLGNSTTYANPGGTDLWPAANPTRVGYTFKEWNTQADGLGDVYTKTDKVTADKTIFAIWTPIDYKVTFDPGTHGSWTQKTHGTMHYEDYVPNPPTNHTGSVNEFYKFTGWKLVDDTDFLSLNSAQLDALLDTLPLLSTADAIAMQVGTGDVTFIAQWAEDVKYTIIFAPGSAGTWDEADETHPDRYVNTNCPPPLNTALDANHKPLYEFVDWVDERGNHYTTANLPKVTEDMTYTAQWRWTSYEYTVIFAPGVHGMWDAAAYTTTPLHYGDTTPPAADAFDALTPLFDPGWLFAGWFDENGVVYLPDYGMNSAGANVPPSVTGNMTYTALWVPDDGSQYIVTYAPGLHGTFLPQINPPQPHTLGATDIPPNHRVGEAGWTFDGWDAVSNRPEFTLTYAPGDLLHGAPSDLAITDTIYVSYTALWTMTEYTIIFAPGTKGSWAEADKTTMGLHYDDPCPASGTTPGEQGWTFTGWIDEDGVAWGPLDPLPRVERNMTYTAQWKAPIPHDPPPADTPPGETPPDPPTGTDDPPTPVIRINQPPGETPKTPDTPGTATPPATPRVPNTPGNPNTPNNPNTPGTPGNPQTPGSPGAPPVTPSTTTDRVPPIPNAPADKLTPNGEDEYIEWNEFSIPVGTWFFDKDTNQWIYVPKDMPISIAPKANPKTSDWEGSPWQILKAMALLAAVSIPAAVAVRKKAGARK